MFLRFRLKHVLGSKKKIQCLTSKFVFILRSPAFEKRANQIEPKLHSAVLTVL